MALFLPFFLLLLVVAIILRIDPFFTVIWFLVGLYVLSRLWVRHCLQRLRIERRFVNRAFTGESVPVELAVINTSLLPLPWLEIDESVPLDLRREPFPGQVVTLGPRGRRVFHYDLHCRRRGSYEIGPLRSQTGDLLGIDHRTLVAQEPERLIVYPRVVPLERLGLPTRSALVTLPAQTPLFEDPSRVIGVRAYQPYDSPRRIHWTATARTGQLLVKQYQPAIARETMICLDLDLRDYDLRQRHDATETAIIVAASLAHHMTIREGLPAGLATEARDPLLDARRRVVLPPRAGRAHLIAVLEALAWVQAAPGEGFVDLLRQESVHLAWGATMVIVTGSVDDALAETALYLKRSGHAPTLILIQPGPRAEDGNARSSIAGIPIHRVWNDRDLAAL